MFLKCLLLTSSRDVQMMWRSHSTTHTVGTLLRGVSGVLSNANLAPLAAMKTSSVPSQQQQPQSHWEQSLKPICTKATCHSEKYASPGAFTVEPLS